MITIKPDTWFYCTLWDWTVRAGNCVECEHYNKPSCPHPELANCDNRDGCPHCGSLTKHKSSCPDQQIINAFKNLKSMNSKSKRTER